MRSKRWSEGLGLLPALGLMVACGGAVAPETPEAAPVEARPVEAAAVTAECKPVTHYMDTDLWVTYDTHVVQASAGTSYGEETRLLSDGSPRQDVYLRFDYGDFGPFVRARLRLYATDGSTDGPALYATASGWVENTLTWSNRPAPTGSALGNVGAVTAGSWVEYDVTSAVGSSGSYAFVLVPDGGNGVDFVSSEDSNYALRPQLVLTKAYTECTYQGTGGAFQGGWHKGGAGHETAQALATDSTGATVVAGVYSGSGSLGGDTFPSQGGLMLGRYRADGTHEWSRAYPQANAALSVSGITLTPLGNVLMVGNYSGTPDFGTGPLPATASWNLGTFIAKFSPSGRLTWVKGFTASINRGGEVDPAPFAASAVATDANGSLIVTGYFFGEANLGGAPIDAGSASRAYEDAAPGLFVAKFSWEGHHLWSRAYEAGYAPTRGHALATDSAGNVLLGGMVSRPNPLATGPENPFIAKLAPSGEELWFRVLHGSLGQVSGVAVLPGDAVAFAGYFRGSFNFAGQVVRNSDPEPEASWQTADLMMGVLEASGADRWARARGTPTDEYARSLVADAQGNLTLLGSSRSSTDVGGGPIGPGWYNERGFVARYTADGSHRWSRTLDPDLSALLLGALPDGSTRVGGSFEGTVEVEATQFGPARGQDVLLLKLAP